MHNVNATHILPMVSWAARALVAVATLLGHSPVSNDVVARCDFSGSAQCPPLHWEAVTTQTL